uniref:Uncharacterized protein n=1 Tax=Panagrellus redivivus TaxID=6233 RepID=A0A7E4W0R5_PANRE
MEGYDFNGTYIIPPNGAVYFNGTFQDEADVDLAKLLPSIRFVVKMGIVAVICTFHILILIYNNIVRSREVQPVYDEFTDKFEDLVYKITHLKALIPSPWLFKYSLIFALSTIFMALILLVFVIIHNCMKCCYKRSEKKEQKRTGIKVAGKMGPPPKPNPSPTPGKPQPKPNATEDTVNKTQTTGDMPKSKSASVNLKSEANQDTNFLKSDVKQDTNLNTDLQMK